MSGGCVRLLCLRDQIPKEKQLKEGKNYFSSHLHYSIIAGRTWQSTAVHFMADRKQRKGV
jgi:hypothetical protein